MIKMENLRNLFVDLASEYKGKEVFYGKHQRTIADFPRVVRNAKKFGGCSLMGCNCSPGHLAVVDVGDEIVSIKFVDEIHLEAYLYALHNLGYQSVEVGQQ